MEDEGCMWEGVCCRNDCKAPWIFEVGVLIE